MLYDCVLLRADGGASCARGREAKAEWRRAEDGAREARPREETGGTIETGKEADAERWKGRGAEGSDKAG